MKLIVSEPEFKKLVGSHFIEPLGGGKYKLKAEGLNGTIINFQLTIETNNDTPKELGNFAYKVLFDNYTHLKKTFPSTDKFAHFLTTRTLRNGKPNDTFASYSVLIEEKGFTFDELINACNYEVWWRKKASMVNNTNKMSFMKGFEAWLNNSENIGVQLSEMSQDEEYNELLSSGTNLETFVHDQQVEDL